MDYRAMFKGEFISAVEFGDAEPTVTIDRLEEVSMHDEKSRRDKKKWVVFFRETDRGWVINRTNSILLAGMFGDDTQGWLGKRITLSSALVQFGAERVEGIRVKGAPELVRPLQVLLKLPRKKPQTVTLEPTGRRKEAAGLPVGGA